MSFEDNPWVERFRKLDRTLVARRMAESPVPYAPNGRESAELLASEFLSRFRSQFIPTDSLVDYAMTLVDIAKAHSATTYRNTKEFNSGRYADYSEVPLEPFVPSICVTGPAGVGKTSFELAMRRVFAGEIEIAVPHHEPVKAVTAWALRMIPQLNPTSLTRGLLSADGFKVSMRAGDLKDIARHRIYSRGVAMISMDETQFNTMSSNANALVAATLIRQGELGAPNVFYCNYSLLHKLLRRPQEDRQRMLGRMFVLLPDSPESKCWLKTIKRTQTLMPHMLSFDAKSVAESLHFWTGGLKRLLGELLRLAILDASARNEQVGQSNLENAYKAYDYVANREDVQLMYQQYLTNKPAKRGRLDLWCPLPLPESDQARLSRVAEDNAKRKFLKGAVESSVTPTEKAIDKKQRQAVRQKKKASVTKIEDQARKKRDALKKAAIDFSDSI